VLAVAGISLVLSSCSGGGSKGKPSTAAVTITTIAGAGGTLIAPPTGGGSPGPDDARLATIVVSPTDLPAGWAGHPSPSTPTAQAAGELAMAQCLGRRNIDVNLVAGVVSQDYNKGTLAITSSARSYLFDDDVAMFTGSFTNPKISTCIQQQLSAAGALGGAAQNVVVKVTPGSAGGPSNVVATASISTGAAPTTTAPPRTVKGSKPTTKPPTTVKPTGLTGTVVFITGPRLTVELAFFGIGEEVPASVRTALIAKVAARAAQG